MYKYDYKEGEVLGELTFVHRLPSIHRHPMAIFKCKCGKEFSCRIESVKDLRTKSCGCLTSELLTKAGTIHGHSPSSKKSPEYTSWQSMWRRCTDEKHSNYERYKQLGVYVCDEWDTFEVFLKDMGLKPSKLHTLDRVENDKGYYKGNCRWATKKEQSRNMRNTTFIEYNGMCKSVPEWAELLGFTLATLAGRIVQNKWGIERAFTTPSRGVYPKSLNTLN